MYKLILYIVIFLILGIYFTKSVSEIHTYVNNYYLYLDKIEALQYELYDINNEILQLEYKINGLSESNINIDLLSYLAKLLLNYHENNSYIIYNNNR